MSVNTKMTAIADEIRTLSGTTGTMGLDAMATNVGNANDEVDNQTNLISQIVTALEGKTAVGGEDVTAETNAYTSHLTTLESVINSLPDAGSGGSGGTIETCTVNISSSMYVNYAVITVLDPSTKTIRYECIKNQNAGYNQTFENVACGSLVIVAISGGGISTNINGGIEYLVSSYDTFIYTAPTELGAIASVYFYSDI